jgi:putative membrane protein
MYLWIKALHVISFVSWMAALFYLPRLFIYHVENKDNKDFVKVVKVMEYKLHKYIGIPALWATVITGLLMLYLNFGLFKTGGWLHVKLTAAFLLVLYHFHLGKIRKELENENYKYSSKFLRFYNEVPTIALIIIAIMAIVRPF